MGGRGLRATAVRGRPASLTDCAETWPGHDILGDPLGTRCREQHRMGFCSARTPSPPRPNCQPGPPSRMAPRRITKWSWTCASSSCLSGIGQNALRNAPLSLGAGGRPHRGPDCPQLRLLVEVRTVAGPSSVVQCVFSGGPYTTASQVRQCQLVCPPPWPRQATCPDEDLVRAE